MGAVDVRGIDNVLFTVGDLDTAVEFYSGRLGLSLVFRIEEAGVALFRIGAEAPGLLVRRGPITWTTQGAPRVWLEVGDARATAATLTNAGVKPLADPFQVATGWTVEVADPWGNVVGFTDYTTMPERGRPS